jgi:hypothetical protein
MGVLHVDLTKEYTFDELVSLGAEYKFDAKEQAHRHVQKSTIDWWKKQGAEASRVLSPTPNDLPYNNVIGLINDYLSDKDVTRNTVWFSRGPIDYYIMRHIHCIDNKEDEDTLPWKFWNLRDSRSFTHGICGNRRGKIDLPNGMLNGFIEHNALHDCAADIIRIQYMFEKVYG